MSDYDLFISHSSHNKPWVKVLVENLRIYGFHAFYDTESLIGGQLLANQLHQGLQQSRRAILVATPEAEESGWVNKEYAYIQQRDADQPGYLVPLCFSGETPNFPFIDNGLMLDFSDPAPAAYREAFYRLLCALRNQPPGKATLLPQPITIPEPISSIIKHQQQHELTQGETACLTALFNSNNPMQLMLAQRGVDRAAMHAAIAERGAHRYGESCCLQLSLPTNQRCSREKYFRLIGRMLKLDAEIEDGDDLAMELQMRMEERGAHLLFFTRFDDGPDEPRRELADALRGLAESCGNQVRIIFCGGEKLAGLYFERGHILSPLMNAEKQLWPEPSAEEVATRYQLSTASAAQALKLSGGHPHLLGYAVEQYRDQPATDDAALIDTLRHLARQNAYFRMYEPSPALNSWLEQSRIKSPIDLWPGDALLRQLFWDNLLTYRNGHFVWRCEIIRQCGKEAMQS